MAMGFQVSAGEGGEAFGAVRGYTPKAKALGLNMEHAGDGVVPWRRSGGCTMGRSWWMWGGWRHGSVRPSPIRITARHRARNPLSRLGVSSGVVSPTSSRRQSQGWPELRGHRSSPAQCRDRGHSDGSGGALDPPGTRVSPLVAIHVGQWGSWKCGRQGPGGVEARSHTRHCPQPRLQLCHARARAGVVPSAVAPIVIGLASEST
jgi:hypothetical protein